MGVPKLVKVGRLGEGIQEVCVEDTWTIAQLKEELDFSDNDGQAYGQVGSTRTPLKDTDVVNGYDVIIFANKVKGGNL